MPGDVPHLTAFPRVSHLGFLPCLYSGQLPALLPKTQVRPSCPPPPRNYHAASLRVYRTAPSPAGRRIPSACSGPAPRSCPVERGLHPTLPPTARLLLPSPATSTVFSYEQHPQIQPTPSCLPVSALAVHGTYKVAPAEDCSPPSLSKSLWKTAS